jgi:predicted phage-related endonuclease
MIQGTEEWHAVRCGLLTASEVKLIISPKTLKAADNDKTRAHVWELLAQRISKYTEPTYIGEAMMRGKVDEIYARLLYAEKYAPVEEVGFVTNNEWGFTLGYSPDGLVGDDGQIECKSRCQKYQIETITDNVSAGTIPDEYVMQCQTGLLVTRRKWLDFVSYSGGLPMVTIRVWPDPAIQEAIIAAAAAFEKKIAEKLAIYNETLKSPARLIPTERRIEQEMFA